jgi:tellurite resistance protein
MTIENLIQQIIKTRTISRNEQQELMSILWSKEHISTQDHNLITQVFEALQRGSVRVID